MLAVCAAASPGKIVGDTAKLSQSVACIELYALASKAVDNEAEIIKFLTLLYNPAIVTPPVVPSSVAVDPIICPIILKALLAVACIIIDTFEFLMIASGYDAPGDII